VSAPARPCRVGPDAKPSVVIEALRRHVDAYVARHGYDPARMHVLRQLLACRTAKLGAHLCVCESCGWKAPAYNSCRNRHCPQCQGHATALWLEARTERMLSTPHFQVVFTLPAQLRPVAFANQKLVYGLLFQAASSVLRDLAAQRLDARLGMTAVLHTWTTELSYHPHVHFLVSAGGLSRDDERWVASRENYLFPGRIMGAMFRGRFLEALIDAFDRGDLDVGRGVGAAKAFRATVRTLSKRHARWVVHVEPPEGRPVETVTKYLARYVKRVAIADARIVAVTDTDVTFQSRRDLLTLDGAEFVRRFLLHVLPRGFRKVRHYGLYAPGNANDRLETARGLLPRQSGESAGPEDVGAVAADAPTGARLEVCPQCGEAGVRRVVPVRRFLERPRGPP